MEADAAENDRPDSAQLFRSPLARLSDEEFTTVVHAAAQRAAEIVANRAANIVESRFYEIIGKNATRTVFRVIGAIGCIAMGALIGAKPELLLKLLF